MSSIRDRIVALGLSRKQREGVREILRAEKRVDVLRALREMTRDGRVQTHLGRRTRTSVLRAVLRERGGWVPRKDLIEATLARCDADATWELVSGSLRSMVLSGEVLYDGILTAYKLAKDWKRKRA